MSALVGLAYASGTAVTATAKDDVANRKIMHDYARCVVRGHHKLASDAILADATNGEIMKRYGSLIDPDCLGKVAPGIDMQFSGDLYRYALADALVNADFADVETSDFFDRLPLAHVAMPDRAAFDEQSARAKSDAKREELKKLYGGAVSAAWLSRFGECIAREDPSGTRLWILTPPDIPEETSRIASLRPAFASCLDGGTLTFSRVTLRGAVALNYYRLAMATPVAQSRKPN